MTLSARIVPTLSKLINRAPLKLIFILIRLQNSHSFALPKNSVTQLATDRLTGRGICDVINGCLVPRYQFGMASQNSQNLTLDWGQFGLSKKQNFRRNVGFWLLRIKKVGNTGSRFFLNCNYLAWPCADIISSSAVPTPTHTHGFHDFRE